MRALGTNWQSAAGRLAALAAPVACSLRRNTAAWRQRLQGERFGPRKAGFRARNIKLSPLAAPLLRNLFKLLGVNWGAPQTSEPEALHGGRLQTGMAYQPPDRPLKALHYETPVPLFARSWLSEFKRGSTRASMRPRAPLLKSASLRYLSMSLRGRIEGGRARPPMKWGSANWGKLGQPSWPARRQPND